MKEQINLETMSIEQCKALAYDLIAQSEQIRNNLATVNEAIAKKTNEINSKVNEVIESGGESK